MTMKIRITNLGPEPYVALVTREGIQVDTLLAELKPNESTEVHIWKDSNLVVKEK